MSARVQRVCLALFASLFVTTPTWAQQTGTLSGLVRDAQSAVLPGATVTVTSPALLGGARTTVTGEAGSYQFTVPPGEYIVAFELAGFTPSKREGVVVQVARNTRLDVELSVGALQETVTVSGESPVVDTSSTVTQTNITKELYDAIPTGRNPWVMAGLVPGADSAGLSRPFQSESPNFNADSSKFRQL